MCFPFSKRLAHSVPLRVDAALNACVRGTHSPFLVWTFISCWVIFWLDSPLLQIWNPLVVLSFPFQHYERDINHANIALLKNSNTNLSQCDRIKPCHNYGKAKQFGWLLFGLWTEGKLDEVMNRSAAVEVKSKE